MLGACAQQPTPMLISETPTVTLKVVEVEKEVTRIVEVRSTPTAIPSFSRTVPLVIILDGHMLSSLEIATSALAFDLMVDDIVGSGAIHPTSTLIRFPPRTIGIKLLSLPCKDCVLDQALSTDLLFSQEQGVFVNTKGMMEHILLVCNTIIE